MSKTYLGDAVYADVERGMLKLTTEDGYRATNTIYLEPEVVKALLGYVDRISGRTEREARLTAEGFENADFSETRR